MAVVAHEIVVEPEARRVLVVDDDLAVQEDLAKILGPRPLPAAALGVPRANDGPRRTSLPPSPSPFALDFARCGEDAVGLVDRSRAVDQPYALAFVDVRMPPGWDGARTAQELWRIDPNVQVVLCTSFIDCSWDDLVAMLGSRDGYVALKKPFDTIEVWQTAHALAARWSLQRERQTHLRSLEEQVRRRTIELARANDRLHAEMASRLAMEKKLREAQKLDALGRMSAGLGHEINNPLTYVSMNIDFCRAELRRRLADAPPAEVKPLYDALDEAASGAERIRRILHDIRQYSRRTGELSSECDVRDSLRAAIQSVSGALRASPSGAAAVRESLADVPAVMAEQQQLEQVFVNLLTNAIQALPSGHAPANAIHVLTRSAGPGQVVVEIRDHGQGIAEEDLDKVFDPFFTTRPTGQGTGLGLSFCRNVIESFGGRIEIDSRQRFGTTVRILLKVAPSARAPKRATVPSPASPTSPGAPGAPASAALASGIAPTGASASTRKRRARILLVDDEASILRGLQRVLTPHETRATTSGAEAIELYKAGSYDLILCDLTMPQCSGVDVFEAIAKLGPEHARRMVFMTGGACTPRAAEFLARQSNPCFDKPVDVRTLHRLISERLAAEDGA